MTARVLGDVLGGISELSAALQQERIGVVVLDILVRDVEAGGDGVNGLLVGGGVEVRKSLLGPLLTNIEGELMNELKKKVVSRLDYSEHKRRRRIGLWSQRSGR